MVGVAGEASGGSIPRYGTQAGLPPGYFGFLSPSGGSSTDGASLGRNPSSGTVRARSWYGGGGMRGAGLGAGRSPSVRPRAPIPAIPLPPLPPLKPVEGVRSPYPDILPQEGWSPQGEQYVLPECAPGTCADVLPAEARAGDPGLGVTDFQKTGCASPAGRQALAGACRPGIPEGVEPPAGPEVGPGGVRGPPAGESCSVANSFDGATPVLMADGSRKPIRAVRVGDRVQATDPQSGRTEVRTVTDVIVGEGDKALVEVSVRTAEGERVIVATDGHPFWVASLQRWVDAKDLTPGALLRTSAGTFVQVSAVRAYTAYQRVHNLTVDGLHTYYVTAGDTPVLVHNCNLPRGFSGREHYNQFVNTMTDDIAETSYEGVVAQFRGSSVTGVGFKSGLPFGSHSDYDIDLIDRGLFERARGMGVKIHQFTGGSRSSELSLEQLGDLGLLSMKKRLDKIAGRPVNFVLFPDISSAVARGTDTLPARICQCE